MATNQDILNDGFPKFPDPPADPPGPDDAATRYGNALIGVQGTEASPKRYGDYLRRVPVVRLTQVVASNVHDVPDAGLVSDITVTAGTSMGPKRQRVTGTVLTGQVLIAYQPDGHARLTFNSTDAVTECAYHLLETPTEIRDFLDDTSNPP